MFNNPLIECELRCQRLAEHLAELTSRISIYAQEQAGKAYWDINAESDKALTFTSEYGSPPPQVSLVIGEILYNLRSCLDYLVFLLARFDSGVEQSMTQFPICDSPEDFHSKVPKYLKGLSLHNIERIGQIQPFSGCLRLKVLRELSNPDKHRHLLKASPAGHHTISLISFPSGEEKIETSERIFLTFEDHQEVLVLLNQLTKEVENVLAGFKGSFDSRSAP